MNWWMTFGAGGVGGGWVIIIIFVCEICIVFDAFYPRVDPC